MISLLSLLSYVPTDFGVVRGGYGHEVIKVLLAWWFVRLDEANRKMLRSRGERSKRTRASTGYTICSTLISWGDQGKRNIGLKKRSIFLPVVVFGGFWREIYGFQKNGTCEEHFVHLEITES